MSLSRKYDHLRRIIRDLGRIAVAFSGGVDSTLLVKAAADALDEEVPALHLVTCLQAPDERKRARALVQEAGGRLEEIEADPLSWPEFVANPSDRCYHCKKRLYRLLLTKCHSRGIPHLVDGTNADDLLTDRPGLRALGEDNIPTPLAAAGLTKREVRQLSRDLGLSSWNLFSSSCLATRIPSGTAITWPRLETVARTEQFLHTLGFQGCRARFFTDRAIRIEICRSDFGKLINSVRDAILGHVLSFGIEKVYLDLSERAGIEL